MTTTDQREKPFDWTIEDSSQQIDRFKKFIENKTKEQSVTMLITEFFQPRIQKRDTIIHKLADKPHDCEKCHSCKANSFRCSDHSRLCVCGKKFTNKRCWRQHISSSTSKNQNINEFRETELQSALQKRWKSQERTEFFSPFSPYWVNALGDRLLRMQKSKFIATACLFWLNPTRSPRYWIRTLFVKPGGSDQEFRRLADHFNSIYKPVNSPGSTSTSTKLSRPSNSCSFSEPGSRTPEPVLAEDLVDVREDITPPSKR